MTMSEVHTVVRLGMRGLAFLVFDNGLYGTIRLHQDRRFSGRAIGVELGSSDLVAVGAGLGAAAFKVRRTDELEPALRRALEADRPAVIQALSDPRQLAAWGDR